MNAPIGAARFRRHCFLVAAVGLAALASGCGLGSTSSSARAALTCPRLVRAAQTDTIALFGSGGHQAKDVVVDARIRNGEVTCKKEEGGIAVNLELNFEGERANPATADAALPYFVALIDPQEKVLAQNAFDITIQFVPGERVRRMPAEKITVHLPTHTPAAAGQYTVIVGFQLTPDQLAFNRARNAK